jgi:hypothetical protein
MKHQHNVETEHEIALKLKSKEAARITRLIGSLRRSMQLLDIAAEEANANDASNPISETLQETFVERRNNLMTTIATLEERLAAIEGLRRLNKGR